MTSPSAKEPMPALLLAAGLGSRLLPLTEHIPKCLVPVHGRPLLEMWLERLSEAGVEPLIVNTHHHAGAVREYLSACRWRDKVRVVHEDRLLGTGGTLLANRSLLGGGAFMVVHADNLSRFSVEDFISSHRRRPDGCVMTMMLFRTPTPRSCGIVELDGRGVVTGFHEKAENPPGNLANGAVYIMEREALDILQRTGSNDISLGLIPACLSRINAWENREYHRDIGTPESYEAALAEYRPAAGVENE